MRTQDMKPENLYRLKIFLAHRPDEHFPTPPLTDLEIDQYLGVIMRATTTPYRMIGIPMENLGGKVAYFSRHNIVQFIIEEVKSH